MRNRDETPSTASEKAAAETAARDTLEQVARHIPAGKAAVWLQRGAFLGHLLKSCRKRADTSDTSGAASVPEAER
jgi:hypothetical protein